MCAVCMYTWCSHMYRWLCTYKCICRDLMLMLSAFFDYSPYILLKQGLSHGTENSPFWALTCHTCPAFTGWWSLNSTFKRCSTFFVKSHLPRPLRNLRYKVACVCVHIQDWSMVENNQLSSLEKAVSPSLSQGEALWDSPFHTFAMYVHVIIWPQIWEKAEWVCMAKVGGRNGKGDNDTMIF